MSVIVKSVVDNAGYGTAEWSSLTDGETGDPAEVGHWGGVKTLQLTGTFATATVAIQGSMDKVTWFTLNVLLFVAGDYEALTGLAAARLDTIVENPKFIRPVITGGSSSDLKVIVGATTRL